MKLSEWGPRELAWLAVAYMVLLFIGGEFRWGSEALIMFASTWVLLAIGYAWRSRRKGRDAKP